MPAAHFFHMHIFSHCLYHFFVTIALSNNGLCQCQIDDHPFTTSEHQTANNQQQLFLISDYHFMLISLNQPPLKICEKLGIFLIDFAISVLF